MSDESSASDRSPDTPAETPAIPPPPPPAPVPALDAAPSARRTPRTWPQRLVILGAFACALASFGAAGALYAGQRVVEDRNLAPEIIDPSGVTTTQPQADVSVVGGSTPTESAPPPSFPAAEPDAKNFLITGADNNSCIDPDSPYAAAFGDRSNFGERSDTIMMWRVNPATSQVVVLSFPRDLYVEIAGTSRQGRINEAYERDNPQRLIETIYQNFGILTDHFIQVDFCAFQTLVNAVGGVAVPFATPVRDPNTGLNVEQAGCFVFDGDHALAYTRSRKLEWLGENGEWREDPTSDLGRISRQQDFLRRTVARLLSRGAFDPDVAGGLIETLSEYVVTDPNLTPRRMLEFAGVMSNVDPTAITTYQINAQPRTIQGNAVLVPAIEGENMQAILAVFRGQATLTDAPDQVLDPGTAPADSTPAGTVPADTVTPASPPPSSDTGSTLPAVDAEENVYGVVPDPNVTC
jgi:LCP family protein required for cell wall assembly